MTRSEYLAWWLVFLFFSMAICYSDKRADETCIAYGWNDGSVRLTGNVCIMRYDDGSTLVEPVSVIVKEHKGE